MDEAKRLVELIPRLRRYARALVGDRASADDLVQDTLERAWAKLHLYRRGTDLRAWLFTVMHNVHVNRVRATRSAARSPTRCWCAISIARSRDCPPTSARCCCW